MTWIRIGAAESFAAGSRRIVCVRGRTFEVARDARGAWQALELSCRHQGADLSDAPREGSIVTCPRHGWRYDLESGACLTDPATPLRRPALRVEGGALLLELPSALEAPPEVREN